MSIKEMLEKIKPFYTPLFVIVVAVLFFAIGRLYALKNGQNSINIQYTNDSSAGSQNAETIAAVSTPEIVQKATSSPVVTDGPVIGSKSGKKYYFPWCGTVKRILPQNQVHFGSIAEARAAGFVPGGNCKGLK